MKIYRIPVRAIIALLLSAGCVHLNPEQRASLRASMMAQANRQNAETFSHPLTNFSSATANGVVLPTFTPSGAQPNHVRLLLFGGESHTVFLGCINGGEYGDDSIQNRFSQYGSEYSDVSIWNRYGEYGSSYSDFSPWNRYASHPPAIVDEAGGFYGYFTRNRAFPQRTTIPALIAILEANPNAEGSRTRERE